MHKQQLGRSPTGRHLRFDKGQRQLTRRDPDVLKLIGEQHTYRFDQLQGILARHPDSHTADPEQLSETRTRAAIQKWEQLGLARSRKIFHQEPAYVWLTRRGLQQAGLGVALWEPKNTNLDHYYWINEVRADLDGVFTDNLEFTHYEWESERLWRAKRDRLHKEQKMHPGLSIPLSYRCGHRPDAVVHFTRGGMEHHIALEIQLCVKTESWFAEAWNELLNHYEAVWYYVSTEVKKPLLEALEKWQQAKPAYQEVSPERRQHIVVYDLEKIL